MIGVNVCYTEGAAGFCTNTAGFRSTTPSTSVGVGWIADGVFDTGTEIELTRVWSALAATSTSGTRSGGRRWFGGYVNVELQRRRDDHHQLALRRVNGCPSSCGVRRVAGDAADTLHAAAWATAAIPTSASGESATRTQWNPVPQLDIGLELLYTHLNTAYKGAAVCPANSARPAVCLDRRPERLVRDVPLAAQLLSMIA